MSDTMPQKVTCWYSSKRGFFRMFGDHKEPIHCQNMADYIRTDIAAAEVAALREALGAARDTLEANNALIDNWGDNEFGPDNEMKFLNDKAIELINKTLDTQPKS